MEKAYPLSLLCRVLEVSRSGYHAWRVRKPSVRQRTNEQLLSAIRQLHQGPEHCYGSPRLTRELQALGHACSENRVARLMHRHGVRAQRRKRFVPRTTDSDHDQPIAPNRLAERPVPSGANQVWVSDLTYVLTAQGWLYLALVMDLWSRRIVGWAMADHLRTELVVDALEMAIARRKPEAGIIHHSDHGSQYTSLAFGQRLHETGILASRGSRGDCYDNALMESFFATVECELLDGRAFPTHRAARTALFDFIEGFYNIERRHSALGYCSPMEYERRWTSVSQVA